MKNWLLTCILFTPALLMAQPAYDFKELQARYKGENAVIIKNNKVYHIGLKKGKPHVTSTTDFAYTILQEKFRGGNQYEVTYAPGFFEIADLKAASYVLQEDGKYKKQVVKNFEDYSDLSGYIFSDDTKHRRFYFSGIQLATFAEVQYTYEYIMPQFLGAHFFQSGSLATLESEFKVIVDEGIEVDFSIFGDTSGIRYSKTTAKGKTIYTWNRDPAPSEKYFWDAPSGRYYDPHIFVRVKSYTHKGKVVPVLGDVNDLYRFNYSFIEEVNTQPPSDGIIHVVDSLKAINSNTDTLIRNIFYWVQNNIRYIAIEDGLGGYIPRQANDIYDNKYGDCKDKSSIITCMLKAAEIPSYMCWIGSRDLPYTYRDLPTPSVDNHMIAAVHRHGQWIFLDGTASHLQYGYPTNFIQGKEALIAITADSFVVVQVPVLPAEVNLARDSMHMRIVDGVLKGSGRVEVHGMQKFDLTERLLMIKEEDRTKRLEDLNRKGNNKCKLDTMIVRNFDDREKPIYIDYAITVPDYVKEIENNLYVNFWLSKTYSSAKIDTVGRKLIPKEVELTYLDEDVYSLEIPADYKLRGKLPAPVNYEKGKVKLSYSYTQEGNIIRMHYRFSTDTLIIEADDFADWNGAIDLLLKAYSEVIILEKN